MVLNIMQEDLSWKRKRQQVLTLHPEVVIQHLEQYETVPCIDWLVYQGLVHVHSKKTPKYLGVFDHLFGVPC